MMPKKTATQNTLQINSTLTKYPCPHCNKPTQWQNNPNKPFCSERCKLIDLGAWADEAYKIPSQQTEWLPE